MAEVHVGRLWKTRIHSQYHVLWCVAQRLDSCLPLPSRHSQLETIGNLNLKDFNQDTS